MNNFYISVSNGLLEDDHQDRMGIALWQYMWLLDKVTKIDDEGYGWVLGGKPIQRKDFIGRSPVTISRNLSRLEKEGYIVMTHTPYGIVVKLTKAKKRFSKSDKPVKERNITYDTPPITNDTPDFISDTPNKILQVDKTEDKTTNVVRAPKVPNPNVSAIIAYLKEKLGSERLDGSERSNRRYAHLFLGKFGADPPVALGRAKKVVDLALRDPFHRKNATEMRYLFYHAVKIVAAARETKKTNIIGL